MCWQHLWIMYKKTLSIFIFILTCHYLSTAYVQDVLVGFALPSVGSAFLKKQDLGITNIFRILMLQFHGPLG